MCEFQSIQTWTEGETFLVAGKLQPPHPARAAGAGGHPLQQGPGGGHFYSSIQYRLSSLYL